MRRKRSRTLSQFLTVDQGKYFNFAVDDVDRAQGNPAVMDAAMSEAAYGLADTADQYLARTGVGLGALGGHSGQCGQWR